MGKIAKYPNKAGIYKLTSLSGKIYIGKSVNIRRRLHDHRNSKNGSYLKRAINKHGWDSFKIEILEIVENFDKLKDNYDLLKRESYYIEIFNSTDRNNGYNICKHSTDRTGIKCSDETKLKMSKARKGIPLSEEHKKNLRQAHLGKTLSKECRENMSKARMGKSLSQKQRDNLRMSRLGKTPSEDTKIKMSISQTGNKHSSATREKMRNSALGKSKSEEHKAKIKESLLRRNFLIKTQIKDLTLIDDVSE